MTTLSQDAINEQYLQACAKGDLPLVEKLLHQKPPAFLNYGNPIAKAAKHGHLHIIKYLIETQELEDLFRQCIEIHKEDDLAFNEACLGGHIPILKYFILKNEFDLSSEISQFFEDNENLESVSVAKGLFIKLNNHNKYLKDCEDGNLSDVILYFQDYEEEPLFSTKDNYGLSFAARTTNLDLIIYLLEQSPIKEKCYEQIESAVENAAYSGNFSMVQYLLTHPHYTPGQFSHLGTALKYACQNGYLDIVKYLTMSPDIKNHPKINISIISPLTEACRYGHLDIVKFLLTSEELKQSGQTLAKVKTDECYAFCLACSEGHVDVIDYLLTSDDLKPSNRATIHARQDSGFLWACNSNMSDEKTIKQPEVIKYFIFNKNIKKTANIKDFLENNSKKKFVKEVEKLFQQRDLYNRMQKKLSTKTTLVKKRKI